MSAPSGQEHGQPATVPMHGGPAPQHDADAAPAAGEHAEHAGGGHGHGKHKKGAHDGHGGGGHGHGGGWLITYCDMTTLLMTMFICIVTFNSRASGPGNMPRKRDSILYGQGGTGFFDSPRALKHESIVWRQIPKRSTLEGHGAENPPLSPDRPDKVAEYVLHNLDGVPPDANLNDSYALRVPLDLVCGDDGAITDSGRQLLRSMATTFRPLAFDIYVEVDHPSRLAKGVSIVRFLYTHERIHPGRLAVGANSNIGASQQATVRFVYARQVQH
jgi:hypothetical protein